MSRPVQSSTKSPWATSVFHAVPAVSAADRSALLPAVYVSANAGYPWNVPDDAMDMDAVFGAGNWTKEAFNTVNVADLFSRNTCFIWLEGGADHDFDLNNFIAANAVAMETWVASGGSLFLNSAGWTSDVNAGFGGVVLQLTSGDYYSASADIAAGQGGHAIFNGPFSPVGISWTGNWFGHDQVSGPAGTTLITGNSASGMIPVLTELAWGSGLVMFGGMTSSYWHSPVTEAKNLRRNILDYLNQECGCIDADGDGFCAEDDCDDSDATIYPGAAELCNGWDDNCNGLIDEGYDADGDGVASCFDNCPSTANPDQADSDCDGVGNVCDLCPGGDDGVDNNNDNLPDCAYPPVYSQIIAAWKCGNNKVYVCHKSASNPNTNCINYSALSAHMAHGDYLGPCGNASCGEWNAGLASKTSSGSHDLAFPALELFPNPAANTVDIQLHGIDGPAQLSLTDRLGRLIWQQNLDADTRTMRIDVAALQLSNGHYVVHVVHRHGRESQVLAVVR